MMKPTGANVSTAFKVRQVGIMDVNPFPIQVSLETIEEAEKRSHFEWLVWHWLQDSERGQESRR